MCMIHAEEGRGTRGTVLVKIVVARGATVGPPKAFGFTAIAYVPANPVNFR